MIIVIEYDKESIIYLLPMRLLLGLRVRLGFRIRIRFRFRFRFGIRFGLRFRFSVRNYKSINPHFSTRIRMIMQNKISEYGGNVYY